MTRRVSRVLLPAALLLLGAGLRGSTQPPEGAGRFLASAFEITSADLARLNAGHVVSRMLPIGDSREIATFGCVRIRVPPRFYVQQFSDIAKFKRDEAVAQIGAFSTPPVPRDIAALTLDDGDLKALARCRVGECKVQLPAEAIQRFRTEIDWRKPDAATRATELMRQFLVDYVTRYQQAGAVTPMRYADTATVLDLEHEFSSLMGAIPTTWQHFPALRQHLLEYPRASAVPSTNVIYWSKEKMGRKPVVSVTHLAIVPVGDDSPAEYAIASKHIFGSHYLDASLGLTVLVRDTTAPAATYLVYSNRSRADVFGGLFGGLVRKIVTSRARETMDDQLGRLQKRLEAQFAATEMSDAR